MRLQIFAPQQIERGKTDFAGPENQLAADSFHCGLFWIEPVFEFLALDHDTRTQFGDDRCDGSVITSA